MKVKLVGLMTLILAGTLLLTGCNKNETIPEEENAQIANPASVYCEENGGTLNLEEGLCMFEDGSYCEEWSYYRDECQPGEIMYNTDTTSDDEFIDDVEVKLDWNGSSEKYSDEELQSAVDLMENYFDVVVEDREIFYQGDEESENQLSYCQELNSEADECVFFKTNFYIPEQDAVMAGAFEPNKTLADYEWYIGRTNGGEWSILTAGY